MRISKLITKKIQTEKIFRLKVAMALECSERNVERLAKSNSDNLTKFAAIEVYRNYGFTDAQIFETAKSA